MKVIIQLFLSIFVLLLPAFLIRRRAPWDTVGYVLVFSFPWWVILLWALIWIDLWR